MGAYYLSKNSYGAAIDRFETLMKKFPDYKKEDNVLLKLGIAYRGAGQKEKAESFLNRLFEKYPNSPLLKEAKKELDSLTKDEKKK